MPDFMFTVPDGDPYRFGLDFTVGPPSTWGKFDPSYLCESMTAQEWIWDRIASDSSPWVIMRPRKSVQEVIRDIEAEEGEGYFKLPPYRFRTDWPFAEGERVGVVIDGVVHVEEVGAASKPSPVERAGEILSGLVRVIPGDDDA